MNLLHISAKKLIIKIQIIILRFINSNQIFLKKTLQQEECKSHKILGLLKQHMKYIFYPTTGYKVNDLI